MTNTMNKKKRKRYAVLKGFYCKECLNKCWHSYECRVAYRAVELIRIQSS